MIASAAAAYRLRDRYAQVEESPDLLPQSAWRVVHLVPSIDYALTGSGAEWPMLSVRANGAFATQLRRAIDDFVDLLWLLRRGQTIGAVIACREFIERWTFNVAKTHGVEGQRDAETWSAYISRVWSVYPSPLIDRDVGDDWAWLSELLHGRPVDVAGGKVDLAAEGARKLKIHNQVVRIATTAFRQVQGGVWGVAKINGMTDFAAALQASPEPLAHREIEPQILRRGLLELSPDIIYRKEAGLLVKEAQSYRRDMRRPDLRVELRTATSSYFATRSFTERRGRAIERARAAFEYEAELVGPLDFARLLARLFRYRAIAEHARIVATTVAGAERVSLRVAADALDSGYSLWLEDSDLVLPCIRSVIEQTARARTYRLKPLKATKLDDAPTQLTPSRWAEAAGWGRLSIYLRILGEYSHRTPTSRRRGAARVLAELQEAPSQIGPEYTARGATLDRVAYLLAFEVSERYASTYPALASLFREDITLLDEKSHADGLEQWLNRALQYRVAAFGDVDVPTD
jgi:hypothetical protein